MFLLYLTSWSCMAASLIQVPLQSPLIPTIEVVVAIFENSFPILATCYEVQAINYKNLKGFKD
jgi:hypothetical protein